MSRFPGLLQRPYNFGSDLARIQFGLGWGSWCEYAASRLSASFYPEQVAHFEETFFAALDGLDDRVGAAMDAFSGDGDGWSASTLSRESTIAFSHLLHTSLDT